MKFELIKRIIFLILIIHIVKQKSSCQLDLQNNLSNAVNIKYMGKPMGSGLYFLNDSTLYLITASHVLFKINTLDQITNDLSVKHIELVSYSEVDFVKNESIIEVDLLMNINVFKHPVKDISIVKIARLGRVKSKQEVIVTTMQGVKVKKHNGLISSFDKEQLLNISSLSHGNDVSVIGYPSYLDQPSRNGTKVFDFSYPLIQGGIISGINLDIGSIIISGSVFYGNSGGAVMYKVDTITYEGPNLMFIKKYKLIGIVSQFIPFKYPKKDLPRLPEDYDVSNSGYTVVVPIQYAIELMTK